MSSLLEKIGKVGEVLAAWLLAAVTVIVALQVLFRYVLGIIAPWTEELARYTAVWMVYLGIIVATVRKDHIKVTVLVNRFPAAGRISAEFLAIFVAFFVSLIVFIGSIRLIANNWQQMAVTIPVSVTVLYIPLIIFSSLSMLVLIGRTVEIVKGSAR
ncbi:TRAP transporter small permease [Marispirochaeta aestuarii]|uniref:TRAP transporter small permease n=1 Tax=Marispirochaeta aestuarii TaxID=1963862 RepID=UPI001301FDD8|nr:TRAP transporter small permease [Marispirochaeta aestuarii]